MRADIHIGKQGYEKAVPEIKQRLKQKKELRVKVNRPLISGRMKKFTQEVAEKVATEVGAKVSMVRGRTFVLTKVNQ